MLRRLSLRPPRPGAGGRGLRCGAPRPGGLVGSPPTRGRPREPLVPLARCQPKARTEELKLVEGEEVKEIKELVQEAEDFVPRRRIHRHDVRSGSVLKANAANVLRGKIKKANREEKVHHLLVRHERNMNVSLICLAMVRLRRLSKRDSGRRPRRDEAANKVVTRGTRVLQNLIVRHERNMNPKHIATVLHSMAALRMTKPRDTRLKLIDRFVLLADSANGQAIGNMLWACGKLGDYPDAEGLEKILDRLIATSSSCNSQNLSNTLWSLGTMAQSSAAPVDISERKLELLLSCYVCKVEESVPQGMSNVLWALAKLEFNPESDIFDRIISELVSRPRAEMKAQDLANAAWSIGRLQCAVNSGILDRLVAMSVERVGEFNAQEVSLLLWGVARMNYALEREDYDAILSSVSKKCRTFNARALSTTLWAMGRIGTIPDPEILFLLTEECAGKIRGFSPQGISNVLWALTALSYNPGPSVLRAIASEFERKSARVPGKSLSSILKSMAVLQYLPEETVLEAVTSSFLDQLEGEGPQSICVFLWSFSSLGVSLGTEALDRIHAKVTVLLGEYTGVHLANTVWCYAHNAYDPGEAFLVGSGGVVDLFLGIGTGKEGSGRREALTPQAMANMAWGLASLGYCLSENQRKALVGEVHFRTQSSQMSLAELSNTCWALALLNPQFLDDDGGREVWAHLLESVSGLEEGKVLSQVFHTKLLLGLDLPQHSQAEEAWKATVFKGHMQPGKPGSDFHSQVSACLERVSIPHEVEVATWNQMMSTDIMLSDPAHKVVVEVDGPSHFSANTLKMNGSTLARNRLLETWGYQVVCIPYFEWPSDEEAQGDFVRTKLEPYL